MSPALAGGFFTTSATWKAPWVPQSWIKSMPHAVEAWFLNHWTVSEVPWKSPIWRFLPISPCLGFPPNLGHQRAPRSKHPGFPGGARGVKNPPANAGGLRDASSFSGLGRSPGEGQGNPLQYSCLENPMDRGAWQGTVHRYAELDRTEVTQSTE